MIDYDRELPSRCPLCEAPQDLSLINQRPTAVFCTSCGLLLFRGNTGYRVSLRRLVEQKGPLPVLLAMQFVRQALRQLAEFHASGLMHCHISAGCILIDDRQQATLVLPIGEDDVDELSGASLQFAEAQLNPVAEFLAPEQLHGECDQRSDIYALGAVLYYALSGRVPFPALTLAEQLQRIKDQSPMRIHSYRSDVAEGLIEVCNRGMAKHPSGRFQSALEFEEALSSVHGDLGG